MKALFTKLLPAGVLALGSAMALAVPVPNPTNIVAAEVDGSNDDGRLMLVAFDTVRQVSVIQALGLTISSFEAGSTGNFEFGQIGGWSVLSTGTNSADILWGVYALDTNGSNSAAGQRRVLGTTELPTVSFTDTQTVQTGTSISTFTGLFAGANPSVADSNTDSNYIGNISFSGFSTASPAGFWESAGESQYFFKATRGASLGTGQATKSYYAGLFSLSTEGFLTYVAETSEVPLPAAVWLLLSGLSGLGVVGRRRSLNTAAAA